LDAGETWDAATYPTLRSATATAHAGTGQITTADGTSTLFQGESVTVTVISAGAAGPSVTTASGTSRLYGGESVTWSALPDVAAGSDELTGPLSVQTTPGDTVAISWTERP
ncbi:hypothetical protein AB4Z54_57525, partial [Streptomyces sp. MCAF7]